VTEPWAWLVTIAAGVVSLVGVWMLTRPLRSLFFKLWLRGVAAIGLLLPAPIPGFDAYYAPAFVVALFEAALKRDGQPASAIGLLIAGMVAATAFAAIWSRWQAKRRKKHAASLD